MEGINNTKRFEAVIIGFGKGGKTLAGTLGTAGKTVALVEQSDGLPYTVLRDGIFTHPTMSESLNDLFVGI